MKFITKIDGIKESNSSFDVGKKPATVFFKHETFKFETEGNSKHTVNCLQVIPHLVEVCFYAAIREKNYVRVSLLEFEKRNAAFQNNIIAIFNCHGYTLTEGKYFIDNADATKIFEDEFEECTEDCCEVVVFYSCDKKIIEHSGKYIQQTKTITDKQGVRPIVCSNTVDKIKSVCEYSSLTEKYLKRKTNE